jgi:hypothetical protein
MQAQEAIRRRGGDTHHQYHANDQHQRGIPQTTLEPLRYAARGTTFAYLLLFSIQRGGMADDDAQKVGAARSPSLQFVGLRHWKPRGRCGGNAILGTTAGTYTFTVTGTGSPSVTPIPTATFSLTVN